MRSSIALPLLLLSLLGLLLSLFGLQKEFLVIGGAGIGHWVIERKRGIRDTGTRASWLIS